MGWRDLLQSKEPESIVAPWVGGRSLQTHDRTFIIEGRLPREHGWYSFNILVRKAWVKEKVAPYFTPATERKLGYLIGDRFIPDDVQIPGSKKRGVENYFKEVPFELIFLVDEGLDKFARISAVRFHDSGSLIFEEETFPLGSEGDVLQSYLDQKKSVVDIPNVPPSLDAAFRFESWRRDEAERIRKEEEERRLREERARILRERLGDGALRREVALQDFRTAAEAALTVGGAEYLDHRNSVQPNEVVVRFRVDGRRFECTCHRNTLRIIDAGICLTDHDTDERGDTYFTLESLPGVIRQAQRERVLHVFRHA